MRPQALIADQPISYSKAYVVANVSRFAALAGENDDAIRFGRGAGDGRRARHRPDPVACPEQHGLRKVAIGDAGGIDDLERSVAIAVEANSIESVRAYGNLASVLADLGELERARRARRALRLGKRFGVDDWLRWIRGDQVWGLYFQGEWDEALEQLDAFIPEAAEQRLLDRDTAPLGAWSHSPGARRRRGHRRMPTGLERAEAAKDPQVLWPALAFGSRLRWD